MTAVAADPRVDAYIAKQADFARPILAHLRMLVHAASPDIGEAVKWGMPFFTYRERNLCNMAGFQRHVAFGFWHDKVARDGASDEAMGQFGRIASLSDLPTDADIAALLAKAMALIDAGDKPRAGAREARAPPAASRLRRRHRRRSGCGCGLGRFPAGQDSRLLRMDQ